MTASRDPAAMTPEECLGEIARLFATGYRRHVLSRAKELAVEAKAEPSCEQPVNGRENPVGMEVA